MLRLLEYLVAALVAATVSVILTYYIMATVLIPLVQRAEEVRTIRPLTVTAYSPRVVETDSTPFINASMTRVAEGQIAVSRDLFFNSWVFGRKVWIQDYGIFEIRDLMANKDKHGRPIRRTVDVFFFSTRKAKKFGRKSLIVALLAGDSFLNGNIP